MTPSGLFSVVTLLIIIPTALVVRILTLLNLNAVVLYYPPIPSPHENGPLAYSDKNTILELDLKDHTTDSLSLWLSHILQNHNLTQSTPLWKEQNAPVAVSIHLTVDFAQPPVDYSFDRLVTINMTEPILPQAILPSNTASHLHDETLHPCGFGDHEDYVFRTKGSSQSTVFINHLVHAVSLMLVCFAVWRQAFYVRSWYRSLLRMVRKSRFTVSSRGHKEYARNQKVIQVPQYEDIVSEGIPWGDYPPIRGESSIREWTAEDDYEMGVTNAIEPDAITRLFHDLIAKFVELRLLRITPDSSLCSEALSHRSVPRDDSDCTVIDTSMSNCRSELVSSLSHCKPASDLLDLRSCHPSYGSHHSSLYPKDPELGTSGTLYFYSVKDDDTLPEVSEFGYFTNTKGSFVQEQSNPYYIAQEASLIHLPRQLTSQEDPSVVTCRELVLHSQYPRAWEVDDLVAACRCFVQSRRGKEWVVYGTVGIIVLLEALLANFLASGL
ncbi:hypothetical protein BDM02DRAFT_3269285 [Thelephora ganbajun]|uniref:Uncharacterized protein n=1 Tax=Thelephora ganbajun TaxID=370292 RepID=A0ACB6ZGX9_THEGA|nr:hypothetical protein BDM02DRAFT_3269285 [Thelephora ganbajun]